MPLRVHHLNCGTMCPYALRGLEFVCHVLLVETDAGLVLIDTGFGHGDIDTPKRIGPIRHFLRPRFDPAQTARSQIVAKGFQPNDVRHIVLTHLDIDHAGALSDFPEATVHVTSPEHAAATNPPTIADRSRYFPAQWAHGPKWQLTDVDPGGEQWFGFDHVRPIAELGDSIAMVPLAGHTRGHAAIAVQTQDKWLLHAGDAYFHRNEVPADGADPSRAPRGVRAFERLAAINNRERLDNLGRLQELAKTDHAQVRIFSAHDATELKTLRELAEKPG